MGDNKKDPYELGRGGIMGLAECYAIATRAYIIAFGRLPEPEGVQFWAQWLHDQILREPSLRRGQLVVKFVQNFLSTDEAASNLVAAGWYEQMIFNGLGQCVGHMADKEIPDCIYERDDVERTMRGLLLGWEAVAHTQERVNCILDREGFPPIKA